MRIFADDSKLMLFLSKFFDIVIVSMFFLLCCIPIVTIGPALRALYGATRKVVVRREGYVARTFFRFFFRDFRAALVPWLILLLISVLMGFNIVFAASYWKNAFGVVTLALYFAVLCVVQLLTAYIFPILARFECKGRQLWNNVASIAVTHLGKSIGLFFLQLLFYLLMAAGFLLFPLLLFFVPVGFAVLQSLILEKIFAEYTDDEEGAAF